MTVTKNKMLVSQVFQKRRSDRVIQVVPLCHGYFMCVMSTCCLIAGIHCYRTGFYALSISPLMTYASSINYWRNPVYGIRRNIDICFVTSSLALHSTISLQIDNMRLHYLYLTPMVTILYCISWLFYKYEHYWCATIAHGWIHIIANTMNVMFYNGLSKAYLLQNSTDSTDSLGW